MIFTLSAAYPLPHPPYASYFMNISISILYWFCFCSFADKTMMDGGGGDHSEYNGHSLMPLLHFFFQIAVGVFFVISPSNNVVKFYFYMEQSSDYHDDENFIEKNPLELMFAMFFSITLMHSFHFFFCVFSTALCWWNLFSLEISVFFSCVPQYII